MVDDDVISQEELHKIWEKLKKEKPLVFMEGNSIIKRWPDGTEEVLKRLVNGEWV